MHDRITRSTPALAMLTIFILLIAADPGGAQMVPLEDHRELWARAESGGESQHSVVLVQNPFDPMIDGWAHAYVESGPPEEGNDGVVKYTSAHIDGVESELVVRSGHSTQAEPATIEEVRRILYEHAGIR